MTVYFGFSGSPSFSCLIQPIGTIATTLSCESQPGASGVNLVFTIWLVSGSPNAVNGFSPTYVCIGTDKYSFPTIPVINDISGCGTSNVPTQLNAGGVPIFTTSNCPV